MIEYPKVIRVGGVTLTVNDAAEEARWLKSALTGTEVLAAPINHAEPDPEPETEPEPVAEPKPAPVDPPTKTRKKRTAKKYQ